MKKQFNNVRYEAESKIATITIDRPERKNAIDIETMLELSEVVQQIEENSEILVMILTGSGDEVFIGGGDLKYFQTLDSLYKGREMSTLCGKLLDRIEELEIPVIAAINGYAFGGGCEFALACDFRIASKHAKFGFRQINMGIMTSWGGGKRLVRTIGKSKALMLMLTGEIITSEEGLSLGLVDKVVNKDSVLSEANELAKKVTSNAPLSIRFIKKFANSCMDMSSRSANLLETEMFSILWGSHDHDEAVKAFFEKRKAKYEGK
jgi:enoyl-CoA hydratase